MPAVVTQPKITPEELERMPDANRFELVDGELVGRNVSILSSRVAGNVLRLLGNEAVRTAEAEIFPNDLGYQCYADDPGKIRRPDVSVVRTEKLKVIDPDRGYMPIAADLVVEVVSPSDLSYEVVEKVQEYLNAGFGSVWVIHPNVRTVAVYTRGKRPVQLTDADEITAEPALADFRCKVSAFFE